MKIHQHVDTSAPNAHYESAWTVFRSRYQTFRPVSFYRPKPIKRRHEAAHALRARHRPTVTTPTSSSRANRAVPSLSTRRLSRALAASRACRRPSSSAVLSSSAAACAASFRACSAALAARAAAAASASSSADAALSRARRAPLSEDSSLARRDAVVPCVDAKQTV